MTIDRIGKPRPPPPAAHEIGGAGAKPTGQAFPALDHAAAAQAAPATTSSSPLERLRAGQIDVNGYANLKVDAATSHLAALPPAELEAIRSALHAQLVSDPSLLDLVRTATGDTPHPPED